MAAALSCLAALLLCLAPLHAEEPSAPEDAQVIGEGNRVSIEYTLTLSDGTVADTNVGGEPLVYMQGGSQILPKLESELTGLAVGDQKSVSLTAAEGYGEVDATLYQTVPSSAIPEEARVVGMPLMAQAPDGQAHPVRVHELKGEEIVLDLNHPLAGQVLAFDVRILAIE